MHAQAVADYILVTVPHLCGRMVVNQFTAVFIMLLPYIQLESFGGLSGSFTLHLSFCSLSGSCTPLTCSRERGFFGSLPNPVFLVLAGQFHCWFHDFHAIMGRVGVSECGVVAASRSFAWQPECRCI
jgi:hypothetical protein